MNKCNWIRTLIYIRNLTSVVAAKIKYDNFRTSRTSNNIKPFLQPTIENSKSSQSLVGKTKRVKSKHVRTANWVFACAFWWRGVLLPTSWFNLLMSRQSVSTLQMAGHEQLFLNSKYNREQRKREKRASQPRHLAKTRNWELMIPLSTSQRW